MIVFLTLFGFFPCWLFDLYLYFYFIGESCGWCLWCTWVVGASSGDTPSSSHPFRSAPQVTKVKVRIMWGVVVASFGDAISSSRPFRSSSQVTKVKFRGGVRVHGHGQDQDQGHGHARYYYQGQGLLAIGYGPKQDHGVDLNIDRDHGLDSTMDHAQLPIALIAIDMVLIRIKA